MLHMTPFTLKGFADVHSLVIPTGKGFPTLLSLCFHPFLSCPPCCCPSSFLSACSALIVFPFGFLFPPPFFYPTGTDLEVFLNHCPLFLPVFPDGDFFIVWHEAPRLFPPPTPPPDMTPFFRTPFPFLPPPFPPLSFSVSSLCLFLIR